jgi:triosephosphate isomerase (TIM)
MSNLHRTLIVANWKMHFNVSQASLMMHRLQERIPLSRDVETVIAAPFTSLQPLSMQIDRRKFRLAAQNAYHKDEGAFMGEISFTMLCDLVHYCVIGHSERRIYFGETDDLVRDKTAAAVRNGITPIVCVGENLEERKHGATKQVIHDQLSVALSNLTPREVQDIVIAYEPIWAITTFGGKISTPTEIKEAIDCVRNYVSDIFGPKAAKYVRVLTGGSVDNENAASYLSIPGCDGALVGGASLNYMKFAGIIEAARKLKQNERQA